MFNEYMWQTYLNAGGKDVVEVFRNFVEGESFTPQSGKEYVALIKRLHSSYCASEFIVADTEEILEELINHISENIVVDECIPVVDMPIEKMSLKQTTRTLFYGIKKLYNCDDQTVFSCFSDSIAYFTTFLYFLLSDLFVPYYFQGNFNILEKIAKEFGIKLPPIPIKKDYKGRFFYYRDICAALIEFREEHNMSPYELCAFLYDFAPKYVGGIDSYIIKNLPEPKSAFFIGGSKDDVLQDDEKDTITFWQCSPETRAGDMIVMYLRSPISAVDSVWRSLSIGFNDPFFYYYRCTYIGRPVGINRISQKQLQQDEIFKDISIVRKNMQGINGVELLPSQYNHLMDISQADVNVPRLKLAVSKGNQTFNREKDVENKLIIPLLKKLGYSDDEYVQQLYIEVGNHNYALIPDFVLLPVYTKGQQSAFAIIEAKLYISNQNEMEDVKIQARSYARQLITKYAVIADKNKIWISSAEDGYTNDIFSATWRELNNADTFSKLLKLIGKKDK